jgi:general stress protein 26
VSKTVEKSINFINHSARGVLLTLDKEQEIHGRPIGAFGNDGLDIFFASRKATKKAEHIDLNPKITFYIENPGTAAGEFKYLSVTGEAWAIVEKSKLEKAIEVISIKYPKINEISQSKDFSEWSIYEIKAKHVKYYENTEGGPLEIIKEV